MIQKGDIMIRKEGIMEKAKQNIGWLYAVVLAALVLPLLWCGDKGLLYVGKVLVIQGVSLLGSFLMFRALYQDRLAVLLGVTLYVASPWRFDLCFVQGKLLLSAVWALVPLYLFFLIRVGDKNAESRKRWASAVLGAGVLACIGYGSDVMFCLMAVVTLIWALVFRSLFSVAVLAGASAVWLVGNLDFLRYLFAEPIAGSAIAIVNTVPRGYAFLDFLTSYIYLEGKPGLGLGLWFLAGVSSYLWMVGDRSGLSKVAREPKAARVLGILGGGSLFLATRYFPWELVQRLGAWALKFVSLLESPALFAGFAVLCLPAVLVAAVERLELAKERMPAMGSLIVCWLAAVGTLLYQCYVLVRGGIS